MPLIELNSISKIYDTGTLKVAALDGIDFSVEKGEFVVVLGPSGCGKTTLLNIIGALDIPTSGKVQVAGYDLVSSKRSDLAKIRRSTVSFVFQSFNLFPGLTAGENVQFGIDVSDNRSGKLSEQVLSDVGLGDRGSHFPHELSGGEQQRVAIARALATANPVLLADEPTGELDFATGKQILRLLLDQAEMDRAVLVVTHNREIARIADRVVQLSSGRIVSDGPPPDGKVDLEDLHW
tara:strand:+ start:1272 stop:1979 length:708 start_codon:yes stop_codon:yes gene_type:complete